MNFRLTPCLLAGLLAGCENGEHAPAMSGSPKQSEPWFEEITARAGLSFSHDAGPTGRYLIPAQMGSGAALFDYDNDGRLDIYLIQNAGPGSSSVNKLFHQQTDGGFKDVSAGSGLDVAGFGMGVAAGDVNNDGRTDVLLTEYGAVRLFLNQGGGKFSDVTLAAGLDNPRWATSAAFVDYDCDGWLDLVVGNYLDYDPTQKCTDAKGAPEFCGPHGFPGLVTKLFHNLGTASRKPETRNAKRDQTPTAATPRFDDVTISSGLARAPGPALGVLCADFDGDHWPDIFLADDGKPNRLFMNQRNGAFTEEAALRGVAYNAMGGTAGNMGVGIGDMDGNGMFDLFVTHLSEEYHALWMQQPRGFFLDRMAPAGLTQQGWHGTGFGVAFVDFDHDGAPDLAWVNGLVKRGKQSGRVAPGVPPFWADYAQRSQLFANDGKGNFHDVSMSNPAFSGQAIVGRGLAYGDIDNDGAVDLLVTSTSGPAQLFRNIAPRRGHWLTVRVIDPALGGRDAYGAETIVQAGGRHWWQLAHPASSYLCSNDPRVHFGLGPVTKIDSIEVLWPDGAQEIFPGGPPDRMLTLAKGAGQAATVPKTNTPAKPEGR
jgi:hypothetical protein